MLAKELIGLRGDLAVLRQKRDQDERVKILCALLESFTHEDVILLMAEQLLRDRKICLTEFVEPTQHPGEYTYASQGAVVKMMVDNAEEDGEPIELGDHESVMHAYHHAPPVGVPELV